MITMKDLSFLVTQRSKSGGLYTGSHRWVMLFVPVTITQHLPGGGMTWDITSINMAPGLQVTSTDVLSVTIPLIRQLRSRPWRSPQKQFFSMTGVLYKSVVSCNLTNFNASFAYYICLFLFRLDVTGLWSVVCGRVSSKSIFSCNHRFTVFVHTHATFCLLVLYTAGCPQVLLWWF